MRLSEGLASATWRRKLEELDSIDLIGTLSISVPASRGGIGKTRECAEEALDTAGQRAFFEAPLPTEPQE